MRRVEDTVIVFELDLVMWRFRFGIVLLPGDCLGPGRNGGLYYNSKAKVNKSKLLDLLLVCLIFSSRK